MTNIMAEENTSNETLLLKPRGKNYTGVDDKRQAAAAKNGRGGWQAYAGTAAMTRTKLPEANIK